MVADQRNELNSDIDSYYKDYLEIFQAVYHLNKGGHFV